MMRPPMLFSAPNSMSDFLAQCIVDATGWKYSREWWNTNEPHHSSRWRKRAAMGTRVSLDEMDKQVNAWQAHGFQFAKECLNAWRLDAFSRHFDLMVLVPCNEYNWPPNRDSIRRRYHLLYTMAIDKGLVPLDVCESLKPEEMPTAGFYYYRKHLLQQATLARCPMLYTDSLMRGCEEELRWTLAYDWEPIVEHAEQVAKMIVERRKCVPRPLDDGRSHLLLADLDRLDP